MPDCWSEDRPLLAAMAAIDAGRYAPEFDADKPRPPAPVPVYVGGTTDGS